MIYDRNPRLSYRFHGNNVLAKSNNSKSVKAKIMEYMGYNFTKNKVSIIELLEGYSKFITTNNKKAAAGFIKYSESVKDKLKILLDKNIATGSVFLDICFRIKIIFNKV